MSNTNNNSVRVTGEERRHPAIRKLARACIEIARLRLAREKAAQTTPTPMPSTARTEVRDA